MTKVDPIEALRARVASLGPAQRETLRRQLEVRGIAWERVAPPAGPAGAQRPERLPLSPSQLHFWVQQQLQPRTSAFHIAFAWRFRGAFDVAALERSLGHLVERHEALRIGFPLDSGEPRLSVMAHCALPLPQTDLRTAPDQFAERAKAFVDEPFDLTRAPLLRAHLFRLGEAEHALALCIHHMVADGWSRGIFMRELAACYRAFSAGEMPNLPPLRQGFADLILAQQDWLASADYQRQKAWWQKRLAGVEAQELPSDRPRSANASAASATITHALPASLASEVSALSSRLGATSFMVLLAAFKLLLHRYTGHSDIAVCVPVAGRRQDDSAGVMGLFVNTLVLHTALQPNITFRDWLARVRETLADAFEHQDFPFPRLAEALGFNRIAGQTPLFQTVFQVQTEGYRQQNAEDVDLGVPGLHVTQELLPPSEGKADLSWHIMERAGSLSLIVEFRTGVFDAQRIERMIAHFEQLLRSIVAAPDALLPTLDYLPSAERGAIVASTSSAPRPLPELGVHQAISAMAGRYPQSSALECGGRVWTYAELEAATDRLARHLLALPELAEPGARVAVCLPRSSPDVVIAFIAILKAGAVYVPLDPRHPPDRIGYILDDADVALILTDGAVPFGERPCLDPTSLGHDAPAVPLPQVTTGHPAYLIYTSGSTGRPKGAVLEHGGLLNHLRAFARQPGLAHGDRLLAITTVSFDISITEMLLPLTVGATTVLADQEILLSPGTLADVIEESRITHLQATPSSWRLLLDAGWDGHSGLTAWVGGEALDAHLAGRILEGSKELWNVYGPTEASIWASVLKIGRNQVESGKITIGGAIENMQFHVLDAAMEPVPDGVPGELWIGGVGIASGYWRRPALTAERFMPNPFFDPANPSLRLYQTGDVVIRRADGEIEFIGRSDNQIKLRGYRIEAGEIESQLQDEPGVAQALVVLDREHQRLVAYCRLDRALDAAGRAGLERDLRRALADRLPRYMVPSAFVLLDEFPLNTSGKVDRKRLPAPDAPQVAAAASAPRNRAEETLLAVWRDVLKRGDIGVEDNFFDLGGDSVIGMQIIARARDAGLAIDPLQMFEHQTVAAQALIARPIEETAEPAAELPGSSDAYALTPLQAGMLFHTLYAPNSGTYFEQCWCVLEGPLDIRAFRAAWQSVIARHEVLRSACRWEGLEQPVQVIHPAIEPEWQIEDWTRGDAFAEWLAADRARGFQLDAPPLMRFALLRLGEGQHRFVWSFHHLLMDGWCGSLLVREVLQHYVGEVLPPAPPPFRHYVEWRARQDEAAAEGYWRATLAGLEGPTSIGIDRMTGAEGALELRETLPASLTARLGEMARASRLTLNTLMQGAWALLLSRYGGQDDVLFGAVLSGRPPELPGVESMIGLFLNTVPVRVDTGAAQRLTPWLQALQAEQRQRERFGYAALTDMHRWSALPANTALFDSLLIVENYPLSMTGAVAAEGGALTLRDSGSYERTHYPMTLKVLPGEAIELALSIDLARIEPAAGRRVLGHFRTLLEAFIARPQARLGEIELLTAGEREQILGMGRGAQNGQAAPVHEQFLARAAATPDAPALEFEGAAPLSYGALADRSQAVAARLQERGVGPDAIVAICMDRGPDLVTALIGVLQAGAAYLPIDPDYPAERIAYVLRDAGCRLALTDARGARVLAGAQGIEALRLADCLSAPRGSALHVGARAENLAYILYTSGSTGQPKGVPIQHGSLSNFLQSMAARPGLAAGDRLLAVTTVAFDIAGLELFAPLTQGATLILADAATARDGVRLAALLESSRASVMQATPAGWRLLVEAGWQGRAGLKMLCGGEALDSQLAAALLTRGAELWSLYGPTETTIWSAAIRVEPAFLAGATVPIGGPLERTQLYVLGQPGGLVPVGVAGELAIGGEGLSPGYWGKPGLTAEKFVPDAFGGAGGRLYRTGDRMRWHEDGTLEFLGRLDGQIKLRGHRIELGEIEARLARHPAVAEAIALVADDGAGPRLAAFIRWREGPVGGAMDELRAHLAEALPAYMLPSAWVPVDRFPVTPNGKIDRRALLGGLTRREDQAAPPPQVFGEPAATLADIWRQALRVEAVGARDNFFELGGHSLLVVTVQSAIRQRLGVPIEMVDLFRFPTLETLAAHVTALERGAQASHPQDRAGAIAEGRERLRQRRQRRA